MAQAVFSDILGMAAVTAHYPNWAVTGHLLLFQLGIGRSGFSDILGVGFSDTEKGVHHGAKGGYLGG